MFLENGAIFIADAHYHPGVREELVGFVEELLKKPPPQLFLMGDIFDLLVGDIPSTIAMNLPLVQLLQELSLKCPCYYFEGNHDFNLAPLFPKMMVFSRNRQPAIFEVDGKRIALAHGDVDMDFGYGIYTALIRNPLFLRLLSKLNVDDWIVRWIQRRNAKKQICKKIERFSEIVQQKLQYYKHVDVAIEGHYHQNFFGRSYINLPSFACSNNYMVWEAQGPILKGSSPAS